MISKILWGCLCTIIGYSCSSGEESYDTLPKRIDSNEVIIEASMKANLKMGELILLMKIQNNSLNSLTIDYFNCGLSIDSERTAAPETKKILKTHIPPKTREFYEIYYYPINSLDLYSKANYRGDLKQKYSLKLDFIKDIYGNQLLEKSFTFELKDSTYKKYINNYGKEAKIQLYDLSLDKDSFINDQKKYLGKIIDAYSKKINTTGDTGEDLTLVSNSDFFFGNRIISIKSNKQNDTLFMNVLIINMGSNKIKVLCDKFDIETLERNYLPDTFISEFFNYNPIIDRTILIKQGARFNILLKYNIPEKFEQFKLNMDWLLIQKNENNSYTNDFNRLFYCNLIFNRPLNTD